MYYDRTVSRALVEQLRPGGAFDLLARLSREHLLADLQLRAYPGKPRCWATLYVGLTKVIDVYERKETFSLKGVVSHHLWQPDWATFNSAEVWLSRRSEVAAYVHDAIAGVPARFTNEGAVQAMLCTRAAPLFSAVDREAVVGFETTAERHHWYDKLQRPLQEACRPQPGTWFVPKSFGGELDLLAIDDRGRLLAIEIKPASATSGIAWAPLQATFYARLFRSWAEQVGPPARDSLQSMLRQRVDLGLTRDPVRGLPWPFEVVPVVAIGGEPKSPVAVDRLREVQATLLAGGCGEPSLELWQVEEAVNRRVLPLT